ncbi:hypothetical protein GEMRC1_011177 [Eukaryota sp. GEM-RC1]
MKLHQHVPALSAPLVSLTVVSVVELLLFPLFKSAFTSSSVLSASFFILLGCAVSMASVRPFSLRFSLSQFSSVPRIMSSVKPIFPISVLILLAFFLYSFSVSSVLSSDLIPFLLPPLISTLRTMSYSFFGRSSGWTGSVYNRNRSVLLLFLFLSVVCLFLHVSWVKSALILTLLTISIVLFSFSFSKSSKGSRKNTQHRLFI